MYMRESMHETRHAYLKYMLERRVDFVSTIHVENETDDTCRVSLHGYADLSATGPISESLELAASLDRVAGTCSLSTKTRTLVLEGQDLSAPVAPLVRIVVVEGAETTPA